MTRVKMLSFSSTSLAVELKFYHLISSLQQEIPDSTNTTWLLDLIDGQLSLKFRPGFLEQGT